MNDLNNFNPDNFKKWMKSQNGFETEIKRDEGIEVETKFGPKRIMRHMTLETGRAGKVIRDFIQNGGVVKEIDGNRCLVEVSSGSFYINKRYLIT